MPNRRNNNKSSKQGKAKQQQQQQQVQRRQQPRPRSNPTPKRSYLGELGANLGELAGSAISKFFGLGAYQLKQNSIMDQVTGNQVPAMHSTSESVVFRHREYIADISSSDAFTQTRYAVQPGSAFTFPYLSAIASQFQEYKFRGLVFEYKSTSADALNSTNTALGSVILASQYRADATSFANKQQMMNEMWSATAKPSESFFLPIECSPVENPLSVQYIRTGAVPTGQDQKLYDLCTVTVGTAGSQAAAVVGELWVCYEIELYKPQSSAAVGITDLGAHYSATTSISTSHYFGTDTLTEYDTIGMTVGNANARFPYGANGYFKIDYYILGTSTTITTPSITPTNCVVQNILLGANGSVSNSGNATTTMILTFIVYIADPTKQANLLWSAGTLPTSPTAMDLFIEQLPYPTA